MLSNPYYLGFVVHNGAQYPGRHEPLIEQSTFDKVQEILAANLCGEKQRKNRRYLTSTLYCGYCGSRMCFSRNKGRGGTYEYWICLGRQKGRAGLSHNAWIADDEVEAAVAQLLATGPSCQTRRSRSFEQGISHVHGCHPRRQCGKDRPTAKTHWQTQNAGERTLGVAVRRLHQP